MFKLANVNLKKLNSLTKYPSIPTYHTLGEKGILTEQLNEDLSGQTVYASEKIDGTNGRIVFTPDGRYIIGSREEFLYAKGDIVHNPSLNIVETLKPIADKINCSRRVNVDEFTVVYAEVYGGRIGANAKQYTLNQEHSFRLFDVAQIPLTTYKNNDIEALSIWRENRGQVFLPQEDLTKFSSEFKVSLVPCIHMVPGDIVPKTVEETLAFLRASVPTSHVAIDPNAGRKPEGLVIRTEDRQKIVRRSSNFDLRITREQ